MTTSVFKAGVLRRVLRASLMGGLAAIASIGNADPQAPVDLTQLSLEDLMNVRVFSVSKKEQTLARTGASVYVISEKEIHRSGATNIPDLLRMVPGVDVARINANRWAISIRGFNALYSDKVLVLVDGRSVYTDTISGVFWDQEDVPLENIDHIEVIRGPGGTIWGANAMNGVINIITKSAADTQGGLITAGSGSERTAEGLVQYGGKIGSTGTYRAFAKYFNEDSSVTEDRQRAADGWHGFHEGFRSDWTPSGRDSLMVQGDISQNAEGQTVTMVLQNALPATAVFNDRVLTGNGDLLARWNHTLSNGSETSLQVYYDRTHRLGEVGYDQTHDTIDVEFTHHIGLGSRHDVVWGGGYRFNDDQLVPGYAYAGTFVPPHLSDSLTNAFVQDEIRLKNSLFLTLGSKIEHNGYTGFDYQPSAQLVWTLSANHSFWAAAAQAVRQPSLAEIAARVNLSVIPFPDGGFGVAVLTGNPNVTAEQIRDYSAGYRARLSDAWSVEASAFYSVYRGLHGFEAQTPFFTLDPGPPHVVIPIAFSTNTGARNYGGDISANWSANSRWKISAGYSLLHTTVRLSPLSQDTLTPSVAGSSPEHEFQIRSYYDLRKNVDWDATLGYVGHLKTGDIPSYVRVDTRLGWRLGEFAELSIVGQNLLQPRHTEFADTFQIHSTDVQRSVFGRVTWRF